MVLDLMIFFFFFFENLNDRMMFIFDIMQLEISYIHYSTEGGKNIEVNMDGHR